MPDLTPAEVQAQGTAMVNHLHKQIGDLVAQNANLIGQVAVLEARCAELQGQLSWELTRRAMRMDELSAAAKAANG